MTEGNQLERSTTAFTDPPLLSRYALLDLKRRSNAATLDKAAHYFLAFRDNYGMSLLAEGQF